MASAREPLLWLATLGLAALASACVADAGIGPAGPPDDGAYASLTDRPCPEDSFLTWENFGDPFMRDWCTGCHSADLPQEHRLGAPMGIDFNSDDAVKAHLERVWMRAGDQNRTMPPAGGPGAAERTLLGEWLACGAPTRAELEGVAK